MRITIRAAHYNADRWAIGDVLPIGEPDDWYGQLDMHNSYRSGHFYDQPEDLDWWALYVIVALIGGLVFTVVSYYR